MENIHIPVLMDPVMELLDIRPEHSYADLTAGDGGHTAEIAERLKGGLLISFDRDISALERAQARLSTFGDRIKFVHDNFKNLPAVLDRMEVSSLDGILVDLGISRYQLTTAERGFSIMNDGPLDMRMDQGQKKSAADLVNGLSAKELETILKEYGEERFARRISEAIVDRRRSGLFKTTAELAQLASRVKPKIPAYKKGIHPATQTFQALRIAVNRELEDLGVFCSKAIDRLAEGGRLLVITFHSLEDRIIKRRFQLEAGRCICFRPADMCTCHRIKRIDILTKKPIIPDEDEVRNNPAARSAKLRAVKRVKPSGKRGEVR